VSGKPETIGGMNTYDDVKKYYGDVLEKTSDLKTDACCCPDSIPTHVRDVLALIADEVRDKYYGCGSPVPLCLEGLSILDLGCGTGRDCYVMSKLVGETGRVAGIDMTANQIAVARRYLDAQTRRFGYTEPNVSFILDYIENINVHFEDESIDVVTSNCVINLTEDKERILQSVYNVLRFGGEMYFADVYADRRPPRRLYEDPVLRGECLGGALYWRDFERAARRAGFADPRIVSARPFFMRLRIVSGKSRDWSKHARITAIRRFIRVVSPDRRMPLSLTKRMSLRRTDPGASAVIRPGCFRKHGSKTALKCPAASKSILVLLPAAVVAKDRLFRKSC